MPVQLKSKGKLLDRILSARILFFRLIGLSRGYSISSIAVLLTLGITQSAENKLQKLFLRKIRN